MGWSFVGTVAILLLFASIYVLSDDNAIENIDAYQKGQSLDVANVADGNSMSKVDKKASTPFVVSKKAIDEKLVLSAKNSQTVSKDVDNLSQKNYPAEKTELQIEFSISQEQNVLSLSLIHISEPTRPY